MMNFDFNKLVELQLQQAPTSLKQLSFIIIVLLTLCTIGTILAIICFIREHEDDTAIYGFMLAPFIITGFIVAGTMYAETLQIKNNPKGWAIEQATNQIKRSETVYPVIIPN